jgi:hypothetical protein
MMYCRLAFHPIWSSGSNVIPGRAHPGIGGLQGYLAYEHALPPRSTVGPYAEAYCRVLGECVFL